MYWHEMRESGARILAWNARTGATAVSNDVAGTYPNDWFDIAGVINAWEPLGPDSGVIFVDGEPHVVDLAWAD